MYDIEYVLKKTSDTRALRIGVGAIRTAPAMFRRLFPSSAAVVVSDENTWKIAGEQLYNVLQDAGMPMSEPYIFKDPNLFAEWSYLEQLENYLAGSDAIAIAVGAGVLNDLTKLASYHLGRRYMIVATTVSMDGFASSGASVMKDGSKQTFDCRAPLGIVLDPAIAAKAPKYLAVSGYADLIAKIPAGADWIVADEMGCEKIDDLAFDIVQDNLMEAISKPEDVYEGKVEAIEELANGLILSGFAMQVVQSSRPASGTEHLFGHYWEMTGLRYSGEEEVPGFEKGKSFLSPGRPVPHGFAVGIGSLVSISAFEYLLGLDPDTIDVEACVEKWPSKEEMAREIHKLFADMPELLEKALAVADSKYVGREEIRSELLTVKKNWRTMCNRLRAQLIPYRQVYDRLRAAHAPYEPEMIAVSRTELKKAFESMPYMRDRITAVDLLHRLGLMPDVSRFLFGPGGRWEVK